MTGDDDGDGPRFVIRFDNDKTLPAPNGWPEPVPPVPGESPTAWLDRAVSEDSFVQKILALGAPVGLEVPYPKALRPAQQTVAYWVKTRPEKRGQPVPDPSSWWMFPEDYRRRLGYELERAVQRVWVAVCERLVAGYPSLRGRTGSAWSEEPVPPSLLQNEDMEMQRDDDALRPVPRPGRHPPPPNLPEYSGLKVGPAEVAETKPPVAPEVQQPVSKTLAAFLAAGEDEEARKLSVTKRRERQILAWLTVLHQEQPQDRPNLSEPTVRDRWDKELRESPHNVLQATVLTMYRSAQCEEMRGQPGKRNRPIST